MRIRQHTHTSADDIALSLSLSLTRIEWQFSLNNVVVGPQSTLRSNSRLLSGAAMMPYSTLLEVCQRARESEREERAREAERASERVRARERESERARSERERASKKKNC